MCCNILLEANNLAAPEYDVFQDHYVQLTKMLFNTDISPNLVQAKIISPQEHQRIINLSVDQDRARYVLIKISSELQAGSAVSFRKILEIMKVHGNYATQELSSTIQKKIEHEGQF